MDFLLNNNNNNNNKLANNNTKLLRWPIFLYVHYIDKSKIPTAELLITSVSKLYNAYRIADSYISKLRCTELRSSRGLHVFLHQWPTVGKRQSEWS